MRKKEEIKNKKAHFFKIRPCTNNSVLAKPSPAPFCPHVARTFGHPRAPRAVPRARVPANNLTYR